jgi:DNA-binding NarL/FixJ family response regulator
MQNLPTFLTAHVGRVQEKLGLDHRTDYVRFALEAGILAR